MTFTIINHIKKYCSLYCTAILSAISFLLIYGSRILNPFYTDWLLTGGDPTQHYLGFALYANAPWQAKIGMMNTAAYPFSESIIFTDSIPFAAVIGKLAAPILGSSFQYFGFWGILCFVLQGVLACILLRKYTKRLLLLLPASMLFVFSPIMIRRIFWHTSLASHFVILLALIFIVYSDTYFHSMKRACIAWGCLGILCAFIHIYLIAMCGFLLLGFIGKKLLTSEQQSLSKKILHALSPLAAYIVAAFLSIWLLGGLSSGMDDGAPGLGYYSFNLNGFINPQDWSSFLPNFSLYVGGQYEGFAYLGLGCIVLLVTAVILILFYLLKSLVSKSPVLKSFIFALPQLAVYLFVFLLTVFCAASNELSFGSKLLVKLPLPEKLLSLWGTFRASGRLVWPAVYMLMLFSIVLCIRKLPPRPAAILILLCLLMQIADMKDMLTQKNHEFTEPINYETCLRSDFWSEIPKERALSHIVFLDKENLSQEQLYSFTKYAVDNNLTINDFYFARALSYPITDVAKDFFLHPDDHTLYIMTYDSYYERTKYDLQYYTFDDLIIGLKSKR